MHADPKTISVVSYLDVQNVSIFCSIVFPGAWLAFGINLLSDFLPTIGARHVPHAATRLDMGYIGMHLTPNFTIVSQLVSWSFNFVYFSPVRGRQTSLRIRKYNFRQILILLVLMILQRHHSRIKSTSKWYVSIELFGLDIIKCIRHHLKWVVDEISPECYVGCNLLDGITHLYYPLGTGFSSLAYEILRLTCLLYQADYVYEWTCWWFE